MGEGQTSTGITRREALRNAGAAGLGMSVLGGGLDGLLSSATPPAGR